MPKLLSVSTAKIDKSQNEQWLNAVMYLEPSVDIKTICKGASKGCQQTCLTNSGMMRMPMQTASRVERTQLYLNNRELFMLQLKGEIASLLLEANKQGKKLAVRLNGTSDLDWSDVYTTFPTVQFYEYTKRPDLASKLSEMHNVHITFSRTERHTESQIKRLIDKGLNVAVVFNDKHTMPNTFFGIPVVDGDKHDRRFEDDKGSIIGLKLKGTNTIKEIARQTGFAV